ncbi:MAG: YDG domain-containing protein, partial [Pelosinus sp.]|nr:YDG domain-containing protein [Pelosinus sp.]
SKTYDGTTAATLNGTAAVSAFGSDVVSVGGTGVGTFLDKNVGSGKAITVTGYALSGADASNYNIVQPTGVTANITKADLSVSGITANSKTYDGTTAATLNGTAAVSAFGSDVVSVGGTGVGNFADKDAGSGKAVTVTGYTLGGADAGNYNIVQPTSVTANITKANLTLSGSRIYDGTTAIAGNALTATGVNGESFTVTGLGDSSNLISKNVQTGSTLNSVTGLSLGSSNNGGLAANYNALGTTASSFSITAKPLTLTGITAVNKVYDGTTAATLDTTGVSFSGRVGSDAITLSGVGVGAFSDKNAGTGKTVTVSGYTLGGADAGNYTVGQPSGLIADISRASVTVTGISAGNKIYDGTTTASINTAGATLSGKLGGDIVTVSATGSFTDANAGTDKTVMLSSTYGGADAGNYTYTSQTSATASITPASLTVTANNAAKTYDSRAYSGGNGVTYSDFVHSETSSVLGGVITYGGDSQGAVEIGVYNIVPGGLTSGNYNITYGNGILTVNPAAASANPSQDTSYKGAVSTSTHIASNIQSDASAAGTNPAPNATNLTILPSVNGQINSGGIQPSPVTMPPNPPSGQAADLLTLLPVHGISSSYTVSQTPDSIKFLPAPGATDGMPSAAGSLAVYGVSNGQQQSSGMYQMKSGKEGFSLSATAQAASASAEIPEVPLQGTYAEIALSNGEIGRYFVGVNGSTIVIQPKNDGGKIYISQTDATGNLPVVAAGILAALRDLDINPGTIHSVCIYKN